MSSLARAPRIIRSAHAEEEVVVIGGVSQRQALPGVGPMATATEIIAAAEGRAAAIVAEAQAAAAQLMAGAEMSAAEIRAQAHNEGLATGLAQAEGEANQLLGLLRQAANQGAAIRDQVAAEAGAVITRAVLVAVRRIVGEYYDEDATRTASAVADAIRSASSQEIVSIRVHPDIADAVKAQLVDVAGYVRPDSGIEVGGCVVDLRHGSIDATLDTRLTLMELAITNATGEAQP